MNFIYFCLKKKKEHVDPPIREFASFLSSTNGCQEQVHCLHRVDNGYLPIWLFCAILGKEDF